MKKYLLGGLIGVYTLSVLVAVARSVRYFRRAKRLADRWNDQAM